MSKPTVPEFDAFATNYEGGMEHPLKRAAGGSLEDFQGFKAVWIQHILRGLGQSQAAQPERRVLDFGCGSGVLMRCLMARGFKGELAGCDVSEGMLNEARKTGLESSADVKVSLFSVDHDAGDLPDKEYGVIYSSCVFHHIDHNAHVPILANLRRSLAPGGKLVIFEHNPFNPITSYVVKTTAIDRDARLIRPIQLKHRLKSAGFDNVEIRYLLFAPPMIPKSDLINWNLRFVPGGGQYVTIAG